MLMSEIITHEKLSKTLCETFKQRVDNFLAQFTYFLPDGWQLNLEHVQDYQPFNLIYGITLRAGRERELATLKLDLLKRDPKRLLTGVDQMKDIHQVVCNDCKIHLPIHDYLLKIHNVRDLSTHEHEWLRSHFHYTNAPGGLRLRLSNQQAVLLGFDGTSLDFDLYFAIQIAKIYVHSISLAAEQYDAGFSDLRRFPLAQFWLDSAKVKI